ncbi:MAG: lysylphosphatidylglycerol synthase transmembrane domain-containing protein [Pseudomonadota bacterium]
MTEGAAGSRWHLWWSVGGVLVGLAALGWVFSRLDYDRLRTIVAGADAGFLLLVALAIAAEQLVRGWKWRQLLHPLRPVATLRLFGAIMAGYLGNLLAPVGVSPIIRSWLVARLEALRMSAVLATVALDRLIDGVVFAGFVALVLAVAVFPDPGGIRLGLAVGGLGSLVLFALLLLLLARYKRQVEDGASWIMHLVGRLPARYAERSRALVRSFAQGIVWPRAAWRRFGIVLASVVIKLIAATHFLWAGLAFGVLLRPVEYLFLLVFLGFLVILTHFARIPGGFIVGAVFALGLFGIGAEQALAMVLAVEFANLVTVASIGAFSLWWHGVALGELRGAKGVGGGGG